MSEVHEQQRERVAGIREKIAQRLAAEDGQPEPEAPPPGAEDTDEGAPPPSVESADSDDGELSEATDEEELEEDIDDDDDAPDEDDDADEGTWEQRYKDQQAFVQETREELKAAQDTVAEMRGQTAQRMGEITRAGFELQDRFDEIETVGNTLLQIAEAKVRQANSINLATVPQEQYAQAQQWVQGVQREYQQILGALQSARQQRKSAMDLQLKREVAIAQTDLSGEFPEFQEKTYPALAKFTAQQGVNPEVWSRITDPALIRLINVAMTAMAEPEKPTDLVRKPKPTTRRRSRSAPQVESTGAKARERKADKALHQADSVKDRQAAFLAKKRAQLDQESRRRR